MPRETKSQDQRTDKENESDRRNKERSIEFALSAVQYNSKVDSREELVIWIVNANQRAALNTRDPRHQDPVLFRFY